MKEGDHVVLYGLGGEVLCGSATKERETSFWFGMPGFFGRFVTSWDNCSLSSSLILLDHMLLHVWVCSSIVHPDNALTRLEAFRELRRYLRGRGKSMRGYVWNRNFACGRLGKRWSERKMI